MFSRLKKMFVGVKPGVEQAQVGVAYLDAGYSGSPEGGGWRCAGMRALR